MELIKWANGQGTTIVLTGEEQRKLIHLLYSGEEVKLDDGYYDIQIG